MVIKTHLSKISQRPDVTVTGTLCNRMRSTSDGFNSTEDAAAVTCKFCLNLIAAKVTRRAALSKAEPTT